MTPKVAPPASRGDLDDNMGGWDFVDERLVEVIGNRKLLYFGRPISASPATGMHNRHEEQQHALVEHALSLHAPQLALDRA
jgi:2-oxoglutarate dehydrogenase complex dehydrogenase (E1) component-like enzyme